MNDEELEDLMYRAGLTAQGCWDSMDQYDRAAIMDFAKLVAAAEREACAKVCFDMAQRHDDIRSAALEMASEYIRARGEA